MQKHLTAEYRDNNGDIRRWLCLFLVYRCLDPRDVEEAFAEDNYHLDRTIADAQTLLTTYCLRTYLMIPDSIQLCGHVHLSTYHEQLMRVNLTTHI